MLDDVESNVCLTLACGAIATQVAEGVAGAGGMELTAGEAAAMRGIALALSWVAPGG